MKSKLNLSVIFVAVTLLAGTASFGLNRLFDSKASSQAAANICEAEVCVELTSNGAAPHTVAIKAGQHVQFNSADGQKHNLSLGKGGEEHQHSGPYYSGEFGADEAWKVQFKQDGTYQFHDHYNPKLSILIVVYEPGKDYTIR